MHNEDIIPAGERPARRKFVWEIGAISLFTAIGAIFSIPFFNQKKNVTTCITPGKKKLTTMLTQDGRLVEIDEALITSARKKVSNDELKAWIKK